MDISSQEKQSQILKGYRVLDAANLIVGPYCASLLGDLGAEVIKIEFPGQGDVCRILGEKIEGESSFFHSINRNKKSLTVDLVTDEGREIFHQLIKTTDVLILNYRVDFCRKHQLDYESLRRINKDIIYLSISAFGEEGPYCLKGGTDHILQGASGMMFATGESGRGPLKTGVHLSDMSSSLYASFGVMSALLHRQTTGEGQKVSINMLDASMCLQSPLISDYLFAGKKPIQSGNDSPFSYPVGTYRCKEGYINISAFTDKFWRKLCTSLNIEQLHDDPRFNSVAKRNENREMLKDILNERFATENANEWLKILQDDNIPCGLVHDYDSLFKDEQVIWNDLLRTLPHPTLDQVKTLGNPVRFSSSPAREETPAPKLGADTDAVLSSLGYSDQEIATLRNNKRV